MKQKCLFQTLCLSYKVIGQNSLLSNHIAVLFIIHSSGKDQTRFLKNLTRCHRFFA